MERDSKRRLPELTRHKASGRAVVRLNGKDHYCGKWGTVAAQDKYTQLLKRWESAGCQLTQGPEQITINALILAYVTYARGRYRSGRRPSNEFDRIRRELRPLRKTYGRMAVTSFTGMELIGLRRDMIAGGWARKTTEHAVSTIRRMFKWGASVKLSPLNAYTELKLVDPLRPGEHDAREPKPRGPAGDDLVEAVKPHVSAIVWDMIRLQQLSGARPGEICALTKAAIDASSADVWIARPQQHKGAWRGRPREILFGPRAQFILRRYWDRGDEQPLFSPAQAEAERHRQQRIKRKTPLTPSQRKRAQRARRRRRRRPPGTKFQVSAYARAIARACDKLYPPPAPLARKHGEQYRAWRARLTAEQRQQLHAWRAAHRWSPHQIRKSFATWASRNHDVELAAILLGHSSAQLTDAVYAQRDRSRAVELMRRIG